MRSYEYAKDNELTREDLIADEDFIIDAGDYLAKRGALDSEDPNEIYDAFMEQMRYHTVNELDTVSDLMYAQEANEQDREQMARLFETFDRMDTDFTDDLINKVQDYGWGIATAPSTYIGFATGGSGKVASFAGQRAAQAGLRRVLAGMATGAAVEGAIGAGQSVAQQATRMELDPEREFNVTELALTTGLSAIPGAISGGLAQAKRNRLAIKADELQQQADNAMATAEDLAKKQVKKVVDKDSAGVNKIVDELAEDGFEAGALVERGKLNPIDPDLVEEGASILGEQKRLVDEGYAVVLDTEVVKRVAVVAKELAEKGGVKVEQGQRITEAVAKAIANKEIPEEVLTEIFDTYNISHRELGPIMASTASDAGRVLQAMGQVSKGWDDYVKTLRAQKAQKPGAQPADPDSVVEKFVKSPVRIANKIERLRRSILTSQPVTTIRNFFGGGARVTLDMFEEFWASGTRKAANTARKALGMDPVEDISTLGAGDIARYVWNDEEAKMVADMYMRLDKKGYERMFQNFIDAAEGSNNAATGDGFDRVGSFFNVFNRMSDNFWKKATFAGELSRQTRARYGKSLSDIIASGQFNKIEGDLFERAVEKSFELVYQQTPKGKGIFSSAARGYLDADKRAGFILGALIPFPRFVINQIKFMYEHAPILGMLPIDSLTTKGGLQGFNWSKRIGQQINGLGMLGMAYALRDAMGPETEWYNYTKEDGTKLDLRPFLGPLNMQLYIADAIYRSGMFDGEPKPIKAAGGMTGEILQTAVGSSFRAGTGLFVIDRALPELLGSFDGEEPTIKTDQVIGQILGDYANTYTYQWPIAVARDLYSLTDEELRQVPETKIGLDYLEITALRARRSLGPLADWLPKVSEDFMKQDIPYIPDVTIKHMVPFYNVDRPQERYDIFDPKPLKKIDPLRTAVSGLNISPAANKFVKERIRLQLEPYDIYRAHPFPPADRYIRQELSQRLPMQMEKVINSPEYQRLSDAEKKVVYIREAKYLMNEIRNKTRIDELIAKEMKLGRVPDASLRDHLKWKFESLPKMYRDAVKARLGAPTEDSDYANYLKEYDVIKESWFSGKKMATGGLVQKFSVGGLPTPIDEQMDALTLSEAGIEESAEEGGQSLNEMITKVAEVGGEVWENMNYLDRAALVTAPVPVVGDVTGLLADAYMYATKPEERTATNYALTGGSLALGLPASVTSAIGSSPALLAIFGAARRNPEALKKYEEAMDAPLTKEQEKLIADDPNAISKIMEEKAERVRQETGVFELEGADKTLRFEIDDSQATIKNVDVQEITEILSDGLGETREQLVDKAGNLLGYGRMTIGDILDHEELYKYYPEARNIPLGYVSGDVLGSFVRATDRSDPIGTGAMIKVQPDVDPDSTISPKSALRETLLHELQHYVQFVDSLNRGGSATEFMPGGNFMGMARLGKEIDNRIGKVYRRVSKINPDIPSNFFKKLIIGMGSTNETNREMAFNIARSNFKLPEDQIKVMEHLAELKNDFLNLEVQANMNYKTLAGEAEARLTEQRRTLTEKERREFKPSLYSRLLAEESFGMKEGMKYPVKNNPVVIMKDEGEVSREYISRLGMMRDQSKDLIDKMYKSEHFDFNDDDGFQILDSIVMNIDNGIKNQIDKAKFNGFIDSAKDPSEVLDAEGLFRGRQKDVRRKKIMDLRDQSRRNELPEEFGGFRLDSEVDVPGYGPGKIGQINYNKAGEPSIMVALNRDEAPIAVGMSVSEALEQGVKITKEAPVYTPPKVKIDSFADPYAEFAGIKASKELADMDDPELVSYYKDLMDNDPEEYQKKVTDAYRDAWLERTGKKPNTEVTKRNTIMENAAKQVKEGDLDVQEFRAIADQQKPVKEWSSLPEMATFEDMFFALDAKKSKSPFIGYNKRIEDGTKLSVRLDIPAYTRFDTWVLAIKGPKDVHSGMMYAPAVRLKNVDMTQTEKQLEQAMDVAAGKAKGPFAVMEGEYVEETAEDTYKLAEEAMKSDEWIQVGFDPTRRGYFYDRKTMEPVLNAEEIVQVGALVLAKKAVKGNPKDFKFNKGGLMSRK